MTKDKKDYDFKFNVEVREAKRQKKLKESAKKEVLKEIAITVNDVFSAQNAIIDTMGIVSNKKSYAQFIPLISEAIISGIDNAAMNYVGEDKAPVLSAKFKKFLITQLRNSL